MAAAVLGVCIVYIIVLDWRFPYIQQLPVFDLDYITTVMTMFARNWWIEDPWQMMFSMPYAPRSVETATPDLRYAMYQSWPPGAVLPIYLVAKLMGTEPTVQMVNWLNVASHGLIALFLSLSACFTADVLRRPRIEGVALAILAACLVLLPRGPVYFFSQIYAFDTNIVVYYALVVLLVTLELRASNRPAAMVFYILQIAIFVCGLFVDWLFYFVFATWFVLRVVGARARYSRAMSRTETVGLGALPLVTFSMFLAWRFATPGSIAAHQGIAASAEELVWKLAFRIGNTDDHPVSASGFFGPFYTAHSHYFWDTAPLLLCAGLVFGLVLLALAFLMPQTDLAARKTYFGLLSIFLLSIVPAYAQMIVFKQHTFIHPWSIAKVVVPLAMIPGVFLPLLSASFLERLGHVQNRFRWNGLLRATSTTGVLAFALWLGAEAWPSPTDPYLMGRIDPAAMVPWIAIHDTTRYHDVDFSPDFDAVPFGIHAAVAGKLVYLAKSFSDVDRRVARVCGDFNVVVIRNTPDADEVFDGRTADEVVRSGGFTFLRFKNYRGAAENCP